MQKNRIRFAEIFTKFPKNYNFYSLQNPGTIDKHKKRKKENKKINTLLEFLGFSLSDPNGDLNEGEGTIGGKRKWGRAEPAEYGEKEGSEKNTEEVSGDITGGGAGGGPKAEFITSLLGSAGDESGDRSNAGVVAAEQREAAPTGEESDGKGYEKASNDVLELIGREPWIRIRIRIRILHLPTNYFSELR